MLVRKSCCNYRVRDRGCGAHPVFPAPSVFEGKRNEKLRAHHAARIIFVVPDKRSAIRDPYAAAEIVNSDGRRLFFSNWHLWLWVPAQGRDDVSPAKTP